MPEVRTQTTAAAWAPAIRQRRGSLNLRMGMGVATALIFTPIIGWSFSTLWVTLYLSIQIIDAVIFAPISKDAIGRMPNWRMALGGMILFINAASFGSLSVLLWLKGGTMGGVCASVVLASGAIYAVVNSPRSLPVLILTIAPELCYMLATPVFMLQHGATSSFVTACVIAIMVFGTYCLSTWHSVDEAYASEHRARLAAERARAEAEAALAGQSAFLAAIGHDLRTPIGAILTGSAEMDRVATDGPARAHAALITDAGLMMKALLDNLLDHSKLNAGRMMVEADDFNLRSLLAQTMRLWIGPVRAKGLTLRIEGVRDIPPVVRGDAMRLRQILNNLLSNALKFTETGSVTLRLKSWREEPSGHSILIEVADTGPGLTTDQMGRLFGVFDQTADGISASYGGSGLGLSISRDLAQLMGGRLTARSTPGEGACFTLSLVMGEAVNEVVATAPLDAETRADISRGLAPARIEVRAALEAPAASSAVEMALASLLTMEPEPGAPQDDTTLIEDAEDRPLRVLVVDDHDINRRAVELILAPLGCETTSAADGLAALRICETQAFDVIFMDVRMPELDGRETTRRLRAGGGLNADVPVIAVTADTSPDDVAACMAAGMTYFVSKPLTPPALLGALQQVLAGEAAPADAETVAA
jgi:signal transduction histidine kinase/ActR/RegA family two-component response regulator